MNESRLDILNRYSPYSIDRNIDKNAIRILIINDLSSSNCFVYDNNGQIVKFYYKYHQWESDYFNVNSIFLDYVDYESGQIKSVKDGMKKLMDHFANKYNNGFLITIEIPAEDNELIQILNCCRFRNIETRLHFLNNQLDSYNYERYSVRDAIIDDIPNFKEVAAKMRNKYDRFHSDWSFNNDKADEYISTYIENSIKGFADYVITPKIENGKSDSFLSAISLKDKWESLNYPISKMVLGAVSAQSNKGWLIKLISEMTYRLRDMGAKSIFMNSQATNFAVLVSWEKLGYKIGRVTHILSISSND